MAGPKNLAPEFATTKEVMAAAEVSHRTLQNWVKRSLLPAPTTISLGRRGRYSRWPRVAVEIAAFINEQIDRGFSLDEIGEKVQEKWGPL